MGDSEPFRMPMKNSRTNAPKRADQFGAFQASLLYCPHCGIATPTRNGFCLSWRQAISMNISASTAELQQDPRPIPTASILGYQEANPVSVQKAAKGNEDTFPWVRV